MKSRTLYIPAESFSGAMRVAHAVASGIITPLCHYDTAQAALARAGELEALHHCRFGVHAIPITFFAEPGPVWSFDRIGDVAAALAFFAVGIACVGVASLFEVFV